jgi:predicted RNA-binding Zn-ribbon protein involved in translation (DUF1610 family)
MPQPKKHFSTDCPACGKAVNGRGKYCNNQCQQDYQYSVFIEAWLNDQFEGGSVYRPSFYVRRWLFERAGHKCEKCGWNEVNPVTNKSPLEINHIDGNALNHRPSNLELLCPNCHSLTPTAKALNKGNGKRKYRAPKALR